MGYTQLIAEDTQQTIGGYRPRWMTCMAFAAAVLLVVACAISIGLIMGYAYCYLEYRSAVRSGNMTEATNVVHIMQFSREDLADTAGAGNKTMNAALMSSVLMSRILALVQAIMQEQINYLPWPNEEDRVA